MRSLADFVNFLPPLPLPAEMRAWDAAAVRLGLPEVLLMEKAALAAFSIRSEEHTSELQSPY